VATPDRRMGLLKLQETTQNDEMYEIGQRDAGVAVGSLLVATTTIGEQQEEPMLWIRAECWCWWQQVL
jgi:hypothetical protein